MWLFQILWIRFEENYNFSRAISLDWWSFGKRSQTIQVRRYFKGWCHTNLGGTSFVVGCQGVVQLGGLVLCSPGLAPLRLRLINIFYSLKFPCIENKEHLVDFKCYTLCIIFWDIEPCAREHTAVCAYNLRLFNHK